MANILLADDDQILIDLYQLKFTKAGHKIAFANDSQEALAKVASQKPDIIFLDRRLGDQDGLALLGEIRKTANGKTIPIIMLTNMDPTAEDYSKVKQYAPTEYLIKGKVDLNDLVKKVKLLVKK